MTKRLLIIIPARAGSKRVKNKNIRKFGKSKNNQDSFSIGIGLSWDNVSLDYAMINEPSQSNFGTSNIVSLVLDANWLQKIILNI